MCRVKYRGAMSVNMLQYFMSTNLRMLLVLSCRCHALYLSDIWANNHESRFNLFGLISQQYTS